MRRRPVEMLETWGGGLKVEGVSEERISISASIRVFIFLTIKHKPVQYTHAQ